MHIRDAIDGYVLTLKASRASPSTVDLYHHMLRRLARFAEAHGRTWLDQLTVELVRAAVADVYGDPDDHDRHGPAWKGGESTAYAMVCAVRSFSAVLRADGVAIADLRMVKLPSLPERIQPRVSPEEFNALESAARRRLMGGRAPRFVVARDLALLSFMADTGLRAAEICALNVEDLDLEQGTVTVHRGKGSKPRALSIRDEDPDEWDGGPTIRALRDYLTQRTATFGRTPRQRALWLSRQGRRLSTDRLRSELATLCEEAGIQGNRPPHAFRRGYFSSEYRQRPTALPVLKARMGWAPKTHGMVEVYTRGADIDLARDQPQPLVSKRWRSEAARSPARGKRRPSFVDLDVGSPRVVDDAPPPARRRVDGERAASKPAKGLRLYGTSKRRAGGSRDRTID